ncbi:MAG: hypothetical protein CMF48_02635 [Legionellales bacterium]|nr:hypothetical protein [Legionellales bacterium]|tara:strand:+ start:1097 stop:1582 length:486 start_codon:yes stop_codon:yes gene_type:complete
MQPSRRWEQFDLEHVLGVRHALKQAADANAPGAQQELKALTKVIEDAALLVLQEHGKGLSQFGPVQAYNDHYKDFVSDLREPLKHTKNPLLKDAIGMAVDRDVIGPTDDLDNDAARKRKMVNVPGFNSFKARMKEELRMKLENKIQPAAPSPNWPPKPNKP